MSDSIADVPFGEMMNATVFSQEIFTGSPQGSYSDSQFNDQSCMHLFESMRGPTIAGKPSKDGLNAVQDFKIPLRALNAKQTDGTNVPALGLARGDAATKTAGLQEDCCHAHC